jgi:hypothetical protein
MSLYKDSVFDTKNAQKMEEGFGAIQVPFLRLYHFN